MKKSEFGLAFMVLGAMMWMQSFTYAFRDIDYTAPVTVELIGLFLSHDLLLSFVISIMCAVMGIMLIKYDFSD